MRQDQLAGPRTSLEPASCGVRGDVAEVAAGPAAGADVLGGEGGGESFPEVGVVEMKVTSQLSGRRLAGLAAVTPLLLCGQEIDGHPGSWLGRRAGRERSVKGPKDIL